MPTWTEGVAGAMFGAALWSSGVYAPAVIKSQFTFASNTMLTVMMGASATSAIVFDMADRLGVMPKKHRGPSEMGFFPYDGNAIGGALIGLGMAATGACPGTVMVQVGLGMPTGILVAIGGILGGYAFIKLQPALERRRASLLSSPPGLANDRPLDIATKLGISPFILLLIWVPLCLAAVRVFFVMDRSVRQPSAAAIVPPTYGGLLIGAAQLATTVLTNHAIGTSTAFEDVARWVDRKAAQTASAKGVAPKFISSSIAFSIGVIVSAATLNLVVSQKYSLDTLTTAAVSSDTVALCLAGGFAMVLGARLAGGCTSGHGISGLAKFSLSSLVSTAAMFASAIATAQIMGY